MAITVSSASANQMAKIVKTRPTNKVNFVGTIFFGSVFSSSSDPHMNCPDRLVQNPKTINNPVSEDAKVLFSKLKKLATRKCLPFHKRRMQKGEKETATHHPHVEQEQKTLSHRKL
ncbi:hypothetical protein Prudu_016275 [Prunus dulcis]|uniref:Uncharacterized protein n=1 Tax=Prunus dulcis TaxID=3755 RepID=A0A4Y1RMT5_PRUDU|nr:hypothetical protein Prudu_016275 [Prunus dulcis]